MFYYFLSCFVMGEKRVIFDQGFFLDHILRHNFITLATKKLWLIKIVYQKKRHFLDFTNIAGFRNRHIFTGRSGSFGYGSI